MCVSCCVVRWLCVVGGEEVAAEEEMKGVGGEITKGTSEMKKVL